MKGSLALVALALGALAAGCGGSGAAEQDASATFDSGPPDAWYAGHQDVGPGVDGGCLPFIEICGDRIDQDCDGHDIGCGDGDMDSFPACQGTDPDYTMCDCNDHDANSHPRRGTLAGGAELCDMLDNDCDFRIDESSACCPACASLTDPTQADTCTPDGQCDCAGEAGVGACGAGQTCCAAGCVDLRSNVQNCGFCGTVCDNDTDTCNAGECGCGAGGACAGGAACESGMCAMPMM
ncbi:MAG: MopE-related protein [Sandaracinus sp.]